MTDSGARWSFWAIVAAAALLTVLALKPGPGSAPAAEPDRSAEIAAGLSAAYTELIPAKDREPTSAAPLGFDRVESVTCTRESVGYTCDLHRALVALPDGTAHYRVSLNPSDGCWLALGDDSFTAFERDRLAGCLA